MQFLRHYTYMKKGSISMYVCIHEILELPFMEANFENKASNDSPSGSSCSNTFCNHCSSNNSSKNQNTHKVEKCKMK